MLDFTLTPEQLDLQHKAREFAKKEILPVAWYYDEIDETPLPLIKKAFEGGLLNGEIPREYGGNGWGLIEGVVMTEEFAAACPGLATSLFDNSLQELELAQYVVFRNREFHFSTFPQRFFFLYIYYI